MITQLRAIKQNTLKIISKFKTRLKTKPIQPKTKLKSKAIKHKTRLKTKSIKHKIKLKIRLKTRPKIRPLTFKHQTQAIFLTHTLLMLGSKILTISNLLITQMQHLLIVLTLILNIQLTQDTQTS